MNGAGLPAADLLGAMVDAMQSWNDNMQSKVPGYRDRIVHISLRRDEGGLNLNMPADVITRLAMRGDAAGQKRVERFVHGNGFMAHLWTRYHSAFAMLETLLSQAHTSYFSVPAKRQILAELSRRHKIACRRSNARSPRSSTMSSPRAAPRSGRVEPAWRATPPDPHRSCAPARGV
jgi:hypothetical protein